MNIYALHGFLGLPNDWEIFAKKCLEKKWHLIDLFDEEIYRPLEGFWPWAKTFNARVSKGQNILLCYSMGGRLGLHALIDRQDLWEAAIIISANPGLEDEESKEKRKENDNAWSKRFLSTEAWEDVIEDWNRQGVFTGVSKSGKWHRQEADFSRKTLANALEGWSLGNQENLRDEMRHLDIPILWITGEKDEKFTKIAQTVSFSHPHSKFWVAPNVGHRVPWEEPESFQQQINIFLKNVTTLATL